MKKIALGLMLPLAALAIVAGCTMPGQNTAARPAPGDNQVKVEVEAVQITQNAVTTVTEHINVLVNAVNGNGEPLIADDFKPLTNWDSGETTTIPGRPWAMEFSQAPGEGAGSIILSLRVFSKANRVHRNALNIKCHFFVKRSGETTWTEDKVKVQVGTGVPVTCVYSIQFPT